MSICCTVCGLWYFTTRRDILDVCPPCFASNFAGAQPPPVWLPPARKEA